MLLMESFKRVVLRIIKILMRFYDIHFPLYFEKYNYLLIPLYSYILKKVTFFKNLHNCVFII